MKLTEQTDIRINGDRPWDMQIHHPDTLNRIMARGSLGLGESYMDGWWDCHQLDAMVCRALQARLDEKLHRPGMVMWALKARLMNLQSESRAWQVGHEHYDLGNDLFEAMLDPYMAYSCGYWAHADTLEQAQRDKLDMICRKLQLQSGMRLLDIGCYRMWRYYLLACAGTFRARENQLWQFVFSPKGVQGGYRRPLT